MHNRIGRTLASQAWLLNLWAMAAAFSTYFLMYMFRKPFTAASFDNSELSDWDSKSVIVAAQVLGYLCSKLIGIRLISQMPASRRAVVLILLILASQAALLLFAVLPSPWHIVAIFLNGLPLGIVYGLVLGFLEGRQMTEALVSALCASLILAGGYAKTAGQWMLEYMSNNWELAPTQAERWMPFAVGCFFILPIIGTTWMLTQIPPPSDADRQKRSHRTAMTSADRRSMLNRYSVGLFAVGLFYLLAMVLRSLRDDFAPQLLEGMGATIKASDYSWIDTQVAVLVLVMTGMTSLVKSNLRALQLSLTISLTGFFLIFLSIAYGHNLSPIGFMVLVGAGLYLPIVSVHTTVFERLIALTRDRGNMGFLMYIVDSLGYLAYVAILMLLQQLVTDTAEYQFSFNEGFKWLCLTAAIIGTFAVLVSGLHFSKLGRKSADGTNGDSSEQ